MFGYKKSGPQKWRGYYYSKKAGKYYGRGTIARSRAGAAAAKRSDKTETFACTVNGMFSTKLNAQSFLTNVQIFHPYNGGINEGVVNDAGNLVHGGAVNDRGFRMKCSLYDEFKLDTMKVTITPASASIPNGLTSTLCTIWDRKANPNECGLGSTQTWMTSGKVPTSQEIFNNPGVSKTQLSQNIIYGTYRYCKASSIIEKGTYYDSTINYNNTEDQSPLRYMYLDQWLKTPMAFAPALYCCVYLPATFTSDTIFTFTYKVDYTFTFRNPKAELDTFITVEAPGYVNPAMEQGRLVTQLDRELQANAALKNLPESVNAYQELKSLFSTTAPLNRTLSEDIKRVSQLSTKGPLFAKPTKTEQPEEQVQAATAAATTAEEKETEMKTD